MANAASSLTPVRRLLQLLHAERRDITYLYIYAALTGLISLTLPLGVQSVIGFVSSGDVSTSLVVLISFIVLGTFGVGALQVMQLYLVEFVQQRLFARISFDFAVRLPRVRTEALDGQYLPELMNRLLDVPTLQKGLSTLLIEFSAAALQILFGLLLLSFYHPVFIVFGLLLIGLLALLIRLTGPGGLDSSLEESKYKYRVVAWLEDVARTVNTFRHAPRQQLALSRTDELVDGYLTARQRHFRVLITQFWGFVAFKSLITAALLIIGCWLLISKQLNIGQFVAAEIVIILIITAMEKVLLKIDVVYDALTSLDKIGHVLDLPLLPATTGTLTLPAATPPAGLRVEVRELSYRYPGNEQPTLQKVSFSVTAGHTLGLAGPDGSGKSTLLSVLAGLLADYTGMVAYDGLALRDLTAGSLSNELADNISHRGLFEGSLLQNLTLNQPGIGPDDVAWALELVGLRDELYARPQGLNTPVGVGTPFSDSARQKLLLARALVSRPRLLLLDNPLLSVERAERHRILRRLLAPDMPWTVLLASHEPDTLRLCHRLALLQEGRIVKEGDFAAVMG
ncbi:peptidase domain-containing ABC transporter [Hymenobacter actinosclerus]|uniref:ABC-type bacteriocin/lantibiotic exporter, contains an N-terminal double-glycine peptidase domain n=1 Tax=Hymenobacter actinosclerus TaxID=82805 RepID=A0A1I0IPI4_9BACT|nr:ABC transporter ATP-binding protein [Hymenobacter actinosclerus]SET99038.1 ABC-type bacteriocin/lantibiotic exporter, contains an N-terminal double-glycine peptidase domain [Hymenobacter actinosclerus]